MEMPLNISEIYKKYHAKMRKEEGPCGIELKN